jgi:hypothetical protein
MSLSHSHYFFIRFLSWIVLFWSFMIVLQHCGFVSAPPATAPTTFSRSRWLLYGVTRSLTSHVRVSTRSLSLGFFSWKVFIFQKSMQDMERLHAGNVSGLSVQTVFRLPQAQHHLLTWFAEQDAKHHTRYLWAASGTATLQHCSW